MCSFSLWQVSLPCYPNCDMTRDWFIFWQLTAKPIKPEQLTVLLRVEIIGIHQSLSVVLKVQFFSFKSEICSTASDNRLGIWEFLYQRKTVLRGCLFGVNQNWQKEPAFSQSMCLKLSGPYTRHCNESSDIQNRCTGCLIMRLLFQLIPPTTWLRKKNKIVFQGGWD